jgi:hypothetical protein
MAWSVNTSSAQKVVTDQRLFWYAYFVSLKIDSQWYWQTELQERHYVGPFAQHQKLVRSHLHRSLGQSGWEVSVGMCGFFQGPNDPAAVDRLTIPELRPHVEFANRQAINRLTLDHRYRAEARFFHNTDPEGATLEDGFSFGNYRFRYRLQLSTPIVQFDEHRALRVKVSDEVHVNAGNNIVRNVFEQNRIAAGFSMDVLPNLMVDIGYLNWYQQRPTGDFYNRHILTFTVQHEIDLSRTSDAQ